MKTAKYIKILTKHTLDSFQKSTVFNIYQSFFPNEFTIRQANASDLITYEDFLFENPSDRLKEIESKRTYFIALTKKKIIGRVMIQWEHEGKELDFCKIYSLKVLFKYRNKGIATALMNAAEEKAKQQNFNTIFLSTSHHNYKAVFFYKKNGWKILNTKSLNANYLSELNTYSQRMIAFEKKLINF